MCIFHCDDKSKLYVSVNIILKIFKPRIFVALICHGDFTWYAGSTTSVIMYTLFHSHYTENETILNYTYKSSYVG